MSWAGGPEPFSPSWGCRVLAEQHLWSLGAATAVSAFLADSVGAALRVSGPLALLGGRGGRLEQLLRQAEPGGCQGCSK